MFHRPVKEIQAEFAAEEKYLPRIHAMVRQACTSVGMPNKDLSAILLAVEEGATNIIRHAYLYEEGILQVRITIFKRHITFSLIDEGRSFQPAGGGQIDLARLVESGRKGGLGFYMIQKIMDQVEYISSGGQNELRMTRRLVDTGDHSTPGLLRRMFTLRVKFSFWTFFIVSILVGTVFYFVNDRIVQKFYDQLDGTVLAQGRTIAKQAAGYIINRRSDVEFDELVVSFQRSTPSLQQIIISDTAGIIVAHSDDIRNIRKLHRYPHYADSTRVGIPQRSVIGGKEISFVTLLIQAGTRSMGRVHVKYSAADLEEQLAQDRQDLLRLTGVLILFGIVGIYLLSNYFVKPIVAITRRVRRFSSGDLETQIQPEGADEFFAISSALNQMMTRLKRERDSALERERLAKEIEVASQIQKTLLPDRLPDIDGLEVDACYKTASTIGGDLYDVFSISPTRSGLLVADVSGKGVPASLVMSMFRTVMQIYSRDSISAGATLKSVNEHFRDNIPPGMFVTVLLGIFDSETMKLNFVSAGHNPLLIYRAKDAQIENTNASGMPLGMPVVPGEEPSVAEFEEITLDICIGDVLFMYTDGLTEATDREGTQFGLDRLMALLKQKLDENQTIPLATLSQLVLDEIDSFTSFSGPLDDMTFVVARVGAAHNPDRHVMRHSAVESQTVSSEPDQESDEATD